ncbi:MAG: hypothetical protein V4620_10710 [Bacteroidota bacterium]
MIKTLQQYKFLSIFIVCIHVLYFFVALHFKGIYTVDSEGYLYLANNLIEYQSVYAGNLLQPLLVDYFALRPPLYGYFIAFSKAIYASDFTVLFLQNILSLGLFFYLLKLLKHLAIPAKVSNIVIPVYLILYPAHFVYTNTIMSETVFEVLIFALFYHTYFLYTKPSLSRVFVISLIIGLAMLTKPVAILIGFIIIGLMVFIKPFKISYVLVGVCIPCIAYFSYGYAVKAETGYFQFTSMKSFATLRCLVKYSAADVYGSSYADSLCTSIYDGGNKQVTVAERFNYIDSSSNQFLFNHKLALAKIYLKGCGVYLLDPGRYDLYKLINQNNDHVSGMFETLHQQGVKAMVKYLFKINPIGLLVLGLLFCWNIIVVIAFTAMVFKVNNPIKWLVVLFVLYFIFTTGMMGISRYRVHIFPLLLLSFCLCANQSNFIKKHLHD